MTLQKALAIFGLTGLETSKEVKSAYRKLALTNHLDRGGDEKKMQEINLAYEFLAQHCTKQTFSDAINLQSYKERRESNTAALKDAGAVMFSFIDLEAIGDRLSLIFKSCFTVISNVDKGSDAIFEKTITWRSEDRQKALSLNMYITLRELKDLQLSLSTNNELNLPIHTNFTLFADGRDIKLSKRRWLPTMTKSELFDVDVLLPATKTIKAYEKNQKRAMKRIDGLSFLRLCAGFKDTNAKDTLQIRNKEKGLVLQVSRLTTFGGYYSGSMFILENGRSHFAGSIRFFADNTEHFTLDIRALVVTYQDCNTLEEVQTVSDQIKAIHEKAMEESKAA